MAHRFKHHISTDDNTDIDCRHGTFSSNATFQMAGDSPQFQRHDTRDIQLFSRAKHGRDSHGKP
jgi:hypothetical protein